MSKLQTLARGRAWRKLQLKGAQANLKRICFELGVEATLLMDQLDILLALNEADWMKKQKGLQ